MTRDDQDPDARNRPLDPQGRRALLQDLESIRTLLDDLERNAASIDLAPPASPATGDLPELRLPLRDERPGSAAGAAADIPVLREVVRPAPVRADHGSAPAPREHDRSPAAASGTAHPGEADGPPHAAAAAARTETQGELFDPRAFADRLLNDDWRRERDAILDAARRSARAFDAPGPDEHAAQRERGIGAGPEQDLEAADAHAHARTEAETQAKNQAQAEALREGLAAALAPRVDALLDESLTALRAALAETLRTELQRLMSDLADPAADAADRAPDETD